jgi:hypothetical protein
MLKAALLELGGDDELSDVGKLVDQLTEVRAALRNLAGQLGVEYDDDAHLADVIEKRIGRAVRELVREKTGCASDSGAV